MYTAPPPGIDALHDALFDGAIVRFPGLRAIAALVAFTQDFLAARLGPHDPVRIHEALDRQALAEALSAVQRAYANAPEAKRLWRALFEEVGFDAQHVARDRLFLRFQPPVPEEGGPHDARSTATVGFHRDSWGTNLQAQVNWWAPVHPITAGRTFAMLPELFDQPIANDSESFDIAQVMAHNRTAPPGAPRRRMAPRPLEEIDIARGRPVVIDPGEIIAFSSQHAHMGVPNRTGFTRISLETRTLRLTDLRAGRGAPNVDGRAKWIAYGLFRRLSDGAALAPLLGFNTLESFAAHGA
jgi:hypothetical protein